VCINGYRTGNPLLDPAVFGAPRLRALGLNLAFLVLPLQGPRRAGRTSGDRIFTSGVPNMLHGTSQAVWDARRLISWLRQSQGAPGVGVSGISLGGFITALLADIEPGLTCAIAGVPETDLVRSFRRQIEPLLPPFYEQWGLSWAPVERVLRPVSPLAMPPLVPHEGRFIYAGLVDRWVRPGNVHALWKHWGKPEILWYDGSHTSFVFDPSVSRFVDRALETSGLTAAGL
jgi:hypothetical protein